MVFQITWSIRTVFIPCWLENPGNCSMVIIPGSLENHGNYSRLFPHTMDNFPPFFKNIDAGKGWKLSPNTPASYFPWISMENPGQSTPGVSVTFCPLQKWSDGQKDRSHCPQVIVPGNVGILDH
ncbi:hypothetical protein DPMN_157423 [Dreissena polymorpha]|uniref:Uncharacterized protein n=1 Tax=Dreissena polymorpha TaxID=45954 RepID=A0A9D4EFE3_DREPO|nr:hypothetical protein DPMN_157423 [Dreissena polymorpha]